MAFDYQKKVWGGTKIKLEKSYLGYLRLKYTLQDLKKISGKVLDVGCGGGGFAGSVKDYREDLILHGVDISKKAINYARKNYPELKLKVGDAYKLPYKNSSFDAVLVADVFEHLDKPEDVLTEIQRVLRKGGILTAYVPLEGSVFSIHKWLYVFGWRAKEKLAGHIKHLTLAELKTMGNKCGMEMQQARYSPHLLGQIVDVVWFGFLSLTGIKLSVGLEEKLDHGKGGTLLQGATLLKKAITSLINLESELLIHVPSAGVHVKFQKI